MRRLILWWKTSGVQKRLQAAIVNYADDLVICCKGTADLAMQTMREPASAVYREKVSTSWATRSGGVTPARRGGPIWARNHQGRASSESAMQSTPKQAGTRRRYQPKSW